MLRSPLRTADLPLIALAALWSVLVLIGQLRYLFPIAGLDLGVYLRGGYAVLNGYALHGESWGSFIVPMNGNTRTATVMALPFTYPPFAAVLFTLFAAIGFSLALPLLILLNIVAVFLIAAIVTKRYLPTTSRFSVTGVTFAFALLLLPSSAVVESAVLGQISVILVALVLLDLTWKKNRRFLPTGVLVGIATAVKILPGAIIGYWVFTKQWSKAITAALTTATCWGTAFLILPADSIWYFTNFAALDARGQADGNPYNMALLPTVARVLEIKPSTLLLAIFALALYLLALLSARLWYKRGDDLTAALLVLGAVSLASPVGWVHYLVWVLPLLITVFLALKLHPRRAFPPLLIALLITSLPVRLPALTSLEYLPLPILTFSVLLLALILPFKPTRHQLKN